MYVSTWAVTVPVVVVCAMAVAMIVIAMLVVMIVIVIVNLRFRHVRIIPPSSTYPLALGSLPSRSGKALEPTQAPGRLPSRNGKVQCGLSHIGCIYKFSFRCGRKGPAPRGKVGFGGGRKGPAPRGKVALARQIAHGQLG